MNELHELSHPKPQQEKHYSFENAHEFVAYVFHNNLKDTRIVYDLGKQYKDLYYSGYQLVDEKKYEEAYQIFQDAIKINPVGINARFEMATCLFQLGKISKALEELKEVKPYLYNNELIAKYYRLNGYGYCEINFAIAYACYAESLVLHESDKARDELTYISSRTNNSFNNLDDAELRKRVLLQADLFVSNDALFQEIATIDEVTSSNSKTRNVQEQNYRPIFSKNNTVSPVEKGINKRSINDYIEQLKKDYPTIDGTGYRVIARNSSVTVPMYCVRCLKQIDPSKKQGSFYLCPDCQNWLTDYKKTRSDQQNKWISKAKDDASLYLNLSLLVAIFLAFLLWVFLHYGNLIKDNNLSVFLSFIGACILFALFSSSKVKFKELDDDIFDNKQNNGFVVISKQNDVSDYVFSNGAFANLFAEVNHTTVKKEENYFVGKKADLMRSVNANKIKKPIMHYILLIIIAIGCGVYLNNPDFFSYKNASGTSSSPIASQNHRAIMSEGLTPVNVKNGEIIVKPDYESLCTFTVKTSASSNYYIILKYLNAPTKSADKRKLLSSAKSPFEDNISFYVTGGKTVSIKVPVGVYKLYYATGSQFYGNNKYCFGKDTIATTSNDLLTFYTDEQYTHGHTVTLYKVSNGNFDTSMINPDDLPI